MKRTSLFATLTTLAVLFTVFAAPAYSQSSLDGAWEIVASMADGEMEEHAQPGLFIFQSGYYSWLSVRGSEMRPKYAEGESRSTLDYESLQATVLPVTANSGRFTIDGMTVTFNPTVMINPNRTDETSFGFMFELDGDNLRFHDEDNTFALKMKRKK